jgi:hypothetical protein
MSFQEKMCWHDNESLIVFWRASFFDIHLYASPAVLSEEAIGE